MITQETEDINSPAQFLTLDKHEQETLINWINTNLKPINSANYRHTSYGLKHYFEHDETNGGRYVTNGMFKGAMLECGFKPSKKHNINWTFNPSLTVPTFFSSRMSSLFVKKIHLTDQKIHTKIYVIPHF